MISHALTIVMNELNKHLTDTYGTAPVQPQVGLGNVAEGVVTVPNNGGLLRNKLYLSLVNIKEEKTLKNVPTRIRNDANLTVSYQNPPVFLNFWILMVATHTEYIDALTVLSRAI